jgi:hypothetical protein
MQASVPEVTRRTRSSPGKAPVRTLAKAVSPAVGAPKPSPSSSASRTAASTTTSAKHVWRLRWRWYGALGVHSASWNVRTTTFTQTGEAGRMFIASFGTVTASVTVGTSSIFKFEIAKLPPGGNRIYYMDQADTHVLFDVSRGSRRETSKWEE